MLPNSLLSILFTDPVQGLTVIFALVIAITFHEFSHAWTADRLGDDTPRLMGRVTLSPLAHLDPIGSVMMLLVGFGYGRPVLYNPMRLSRRSDELLIALAGPASNLLLAIICNVIIVVLQRSGSTFLSQEIFSTIAGINVLLAAFNMLPIPPLDGSSIIAYFWPQYRSLMGGQVGLIVLLLLIFSGFLSLIMTPLINIFAMVSTLFGILH